MGENKIIEKPIEKPEQEEKAKVKKKQSPKVNVLLQIINGDFLNKEFVLNNLSFIFYFIFLLILLVGKGYYDKQLTSEVDKTQKELDELMGDYVAKKAYLEEKTKRITLLKDLKKKGLKETTNPTKVIRIPR